MMKKVIALDIGGTNTRVSLINEAYEIEKTLILPTKVGDKATFVNSVIAIIKEAIPDRKDVIAIAGGVPGRVTPDGYIDALPNIGVFDIDLAHDLEKEFGIPTYIGNDAEVAALAEANLGPHKDYKSLYFITISTGVGGALCIDHKLKNASYEVGHTLFDYKGELHEFEHLAAGSYLVRLCRKDGLSIQSAREFFTRVKEGDPSVKNTYEGWLNLLAGFISMIQDTFEPEVFTLTGGVMKSADVFLDDLRAKCPKSKIEKCHFGQEAGLVGAAVFGFQKAN